MASGVTVPVTRSERGERGDRKAVKSREGTRPVPLSFFIRSHQSWPQKKPGVHLKYTKCISSSASSDNMCNCLIPLTS